MEQLQSPSRVLNMQDKQSFLVQRALYPTVLPLENFFAN